MTTRIAAGAAMVATLVGASAGVPAFASEDQPVEAADYVRQLVEGVPHAGRVGEWYSFAFTLLGPAPSIHLQATDVMPAGLTLHGDGTVTGVPTQAGTFKVFYTAYDGAGGNWWSFTEFTIEERAPKFWNTTVAAGSLPGLWASASTRRAFCPASTPYLTNTVYSLNPIRSWGGIEVTQSTSGLDAALNPIWSNYPLNSAYSPTGRYATGVDLGSVTQWEAKPNDYKIVLHCTDLQSHGYQA